MGQKPDVVLSDMAANTTGHRQTDHIRTTHLLEIALDFSIENLNRNGVFLAKCFKGGTEKEALDLMQKNFSKVHHVKPDASRKESVEGYVIALGFKGKWIQRIKLCKIYYRAYIKLYDINFKFSTEYE